MLSTGHARNDIKYLKRVQLAGCYGNACQRSKNDSPCSLLTNHIALFSFLHGASTIPPVISLCIRLYNFGARTQAYNVKLLIKLFRPIFFPNITLSRYFCQKLPLKRVKSIKKCNSNCYRCIYELDFVSG